MTKDALLISVCLSSGLAFSTPAQAETVVKAVAAPQKKKELKYRACVEYDAKTKKIGSCDESPGECKPNQIEILAEKPLASCPNEL